MVERKFISTLLLFSSFLIFSGCINQTEQKIPVIIDADTANEIDDLYAIVLAILSEEFDVAGITSAQFHTSPLASKNSADESQQINEEIIRILGRSDIKLPLGSNYPLTSSSQPQVSEASAFIINEAHQHTGDKPLHLVILGSCTNVASAIIQDPSIVPKIEVHYLGFWHDPSTNTYNKKEFNSGNDTLAVNFLLNVEELDFNVMTATTSQNLVFSKDEVDLQLKGKNKIGDYLVNRWETYNRWWTEDDPKKHKWIMWDVAIIEALKNPTYAKKEVFSSPPENTAKDLEIYIYIDIDRMTEDFWNTLKKVD